MYEGACVHANVNVSKWIGMFKPWYLSHADAILENAWDHEKHKM